MAKLPPTGVRLEPEIREALERAAKDDQRSLSSLISKIVSEWIKENGWLKAPRRHG